VDTEDAEPGDGYIICSSNTIPENFLAMVKAAKKHGEYQTAKT